MAEHEGRRPGLERLPAAASTPDGKKVTLTRDDWLHVRFRHPEVGNNPAALLQAVSHPDEHIRTGGEDTCLEAYRPEALPGGDLPTRGGAWRAY